MMEADSAERSQRSRARDQLREHALGRPPVREIGAIVGDLSLVHAVATRTLAASEQDPTGVQEALAALTLLRHLREECAAWEPRLIAAARASGASWIQLAPSLGVASRQAAERRYLRLRPDERGSTSTGEERVQATRDRRAGDRAVVRWARDNAATLRQLAAQVSESLPEKESAVATALGQDDTTALLGPLAEVRSQVQATRPDLADRIDAVTEQSTQARHAGRDS
ncbi:MAG: HSP18 transcriptional regulator [Kibdelosporangium sp.]